MKISNHIKQLTSILSLLGLVLLLVFSPCKVRNSIQDVLEAPITKVSNKSISSLNFSICNVFTGSETIISKAFGSLQLAQAVLVKRTVFNSKTVALSNRPLTHYNNARDAIPPIAPYYILFKNNKAYL